MLNIYILLFGTANSFNLQLFRNFLKELSRYMCNGNCGYAFYCYYESFCAVHSPNISFRSFEYPVCNLYLVALFHCQLHSLHLSGSGSRHEYEDFHSAVIDRCGFRASGHPIGYCSVCRCSLQFNHSFSCRAHENQSGYYRFFIVFDSVAAELFDRAHRDIILDALFAAVLDYGCYQIAIYPQCKPLNILWIFVRQFLNDDGFKLFCCSCFCFCLHMCNSSLSATQGPIVPPQFFSSPAAVRLM